MARPSPSVVRERLQALAQTTAVRDLWQPALVHASCTEAAKKSGTRRSGSGRFAGLEPRTGPAVNAICPGFVYAVVLCRGDT